MKVWPLFIAGVALLATAWPTTATAAEAPVSSVALEDGTGDVLKWIPKQQTFVPVDRPEADVVRVTVRHAPRAVVVKMWFGDVAQVGDEQSFRAQIRTPKHEYGSNATVSAGAWGGRLRLINYTRESFVRCTGDALTVDYDTDTVSIRVPRNCIGRPAWVRVNLTNEAFIAGDFYVDNAHTRVLDSKFTRRLYRAPAA